MHRQSLAPLFLSCLAACATEALPDEDRGGPSIEEALAGPITLHYDGETGNSLKATAIVAASPRALSLELTLPSAGNEAISPAALARLRMTGQLEVTIAEGLETWAVRSGVNDLAALDLAGFAAFYTSTAEPLTLCGAQVAKAHVVLADGASRYEARLSVVSASPLYTLYDTNACEEFDDWGTYGWCSRINGVACSAVVNCGSALGGTRMCSGDCYLQVGWIDDVCKCNIDESRCCSATLPPQRPVATDQTTRFEN